MKKLLIPIFTIGLFFQGFAQTTPDNWFNLDRTTDGVNGVSTERAYSNLLKDKKSVPVIVAIIDSGVDSEHEDLKNIMWTNPNEIANNGKDDDHNGYIDDIHGWNFIGGKDGGNVDADTYEVTRLYGSLKYKYDNADPSKLNKKQKKEYAQFLTYKEEVESKYSKAKKNVDRFAGMQSNYQKMVESLSMVMKNEGINFADVTSINTDVHKDLAQVINIIQKINADTERVSSIEELNKLLVKDLNGAIEHYQSQLDFAYNTEYNPRTIVGDDYNNVSEKFYGNNDVKGPDASHGTHVAGIVAADRTNSLGMKGVADNVQIMSVRTVPNGDERDKDVANAIIYAVDNGAQVINMSFGKAFSPEKGAIDAALKYAAKHDVLLVHAAGNSSQNNDSTENYPTDSYSSKKGGCSLFSKKECPTWVEVGALNVREDKSAVAPFSNYGKEQVDIFAPGMEIYSTIPDNGYASFQGTSMASPVVAGVAALIRSYYPALTAEQVKEVLIQSSYKASIDVSKPGSEDVVPFSALSVSGGMVNAYNAIIIASLMKGKKKIKA